jgi:hypothetical protein
VLKVIVGVGLTALLGGLLAPLVKDRMDRRSERFDSSVELVEILANGLWAYWKLALRVAYYGRQGERGSDEYELALERWDGDDAWELGCDIQIQVSRSKRLLSPESQRWLAQAQQRVVDYLDTQIDQLRQSGTPADWERLYAALMSEKRVEIDELLSRVTSALKLGRS